MARPKTNPDKHRRNVAITLDPDVLLPARALAASKGRSLSQLLDGLLRQWLSDQQPSDKELEDAIDAFIDSHEQREAARDREQIARKKPKRTTPKPARK